MVQKLDKPLCIILALSVALNIGFAAKVHKLNKALEPTPPLLVAPGFHVSGMDVRDLNGKPERLNFTQSTSVLYVFSPTCHWCAKNLENINTLFQAKHGSVRFIAVSLSSEGVDQYVSLHHFPLQVVTEPSQAIIDSLHLGGTPETIVIDASGTVRKVWSGAYDKAACNEIRLFFGLPANFLVPIA